MTNSARRLLEDALALSENERLELASELLASVGGPKDEDWDSAWLAELDRRAAATQTNGDDSSEWSDVRARLVDRIGRR
jgi:putative addiction module component (TIGR02574 family)